MFSVVNLAQTASPPLSAATLFAKFTASMNKHDPYAAVRVPDFRRFLFGHFFASLGTQMQTVAVGWYLYERTNSALALGGVGLAQILPIMLLTLPAGHYADQHDRKTILRGALALSAISSLGLATVSYLHGAIWIIYFFLVLNGIGRAVTAPARDALAPQLIDVELLGNGATWRSGMFQLAAVLGPALGGLIIGTTNSATPAFAITAAAILFFVMLISPVTPRRFETTNRGPILQTLREGLRFIWTTRILIATISLDLFAVLLGGATMLLPVYAKDVLHVGARSLGWMMAAPSIGAVLIAIPLARHPLKKAGRAMLMAVAAFGAATVVFGLSRNYLLSLLMLVLIGAFDMVSVVIRSTLTQVLTPDELRGRVGAVNALFIGTSNELGGFESGAVASLVGPIWTVVGGGIGSILVVIAVAMIWPETRTFGALQDDPRSH